MNKVYAFEVWVKQTDWARTINTTTHGKAKAEYFSSLQEVWGGVRYTDLRARKLGPPITSDAFKRNAAYRGMPNVRCGQRVKVGKSKGTITGHNSSANFDVLFDVDAPKYAGLKLNCHPQSIELLKA